MNKVNKERLHTLFAKYLANELSIEEQEELYIYFQLLDEDEFNELLDSHIKPEKNTDFDSVELFEKIAAKAEINNIQRPLKRSGNIMPLFIKIAASLILVLGISYLFFLNKSNLNPSNITETSYAEVEVRMNKGEINLADGTVLSLDSIHDELVSYNGLSLIRLADGTIAIQKDVSFNNPSEGDFHEFSSPFGQTLKLALPDGSAVLLNSNSTLKMASNFGSTNRTVRLTGEAFFDVYHNKALPFIVEAKNSHIEVLGTTFNISAFANDRYSQTTLIKGSVAVNTANEKMKISPGQQAVVREDASISINPNVDISRVLAWKEGYFRFKDESIENILRDLVRWYEIKSIEIEPGIKDKFTGSLKRSKQLQDVLSAFEKISDLKFELKERRIKVMK